jgi:hypothetical protein
LRFNFLAEPFRVGHRRQLEKGKTLEPLCPCPHQNEPEIFRRALKSIPFASRALASRRRWLSLGATRDRRFFDRRHTLSCCSWADDNNAIIPNNGDSWLTLIAEPPIGSFKLRETLPLN